MSDSCSFCGRNKHEVDVLIQGPNGIAICNECNDSVFELIEENKEDVNNHKQMKKLTPKEIKEHLDEFIVGQEDAKKVLSVAVYNHYKRISGKKVSEDVELSKSNILLLGSSGSGKTLLAQTLAKILDVPFSIADATSLTQAGYVGDDVESIISTLLINADMDVERAQKGIVYIDEIDKIAKSPDNPSISRDVSGTGVQQALLKLIEGTVANVSPKGDRKNPGSEQIRVDTSNILFIVGGSFPDIKQIIEDKINKKSIGFGAVSKEENLKYNDMIEAVDTSDLIKFGLIPELVGRLPIISKLKELDEQALIKILKEPKNSIVKQYKELFKLDDVDFEITDDALEEIAKQAIKKETGARGLRSIVENILLDTMFEIPSEKDISKVIVDKSVILGKNPPILKKKEEKNNCKKNCKKNGCKNKKDNQSTLVSEA